MTEQESGFKVGDQVLANTRRGKIRVIIVSIDPNKGFLLYAYDDGVNLGVLARDRIIRKLVKIFTD